MGIVDASSAVAATDGGQISGNSGLGSFSFESGSGLGDISTGGLEFVQRPRLEIPALIATVGAVMIALIFTRKRRRR